MGQPPKVVELALRGLGLSDYLVTVSSQPAHESYMAITPAAAQSSPRKEWTFRQQAAAPWRLAGLGVGIQTRQYPPSLL